MRPHILHFRIAIIAVACLLSSACGGSDASTGPNMTALSQRQAEQVAVSLFDEVARAMAGLSFSAFPAPSPTPAAR